MPGFDIPITDFDLSLSPATSCWCNDGDDTIGLERLDPITRLVARS
jgi:hypothetical protein